MNCSCGKKAVIRELCKEHFVEFFEQTVVDTIASHQLLKKDERVAVAASGGKDSMTVLFLLKKLGYNITALAVDEGVAGYRDKSLEDLQVFCDNNNIPLLVVSYKDEFGKDLDTILKEQDVRPCSICGVFRRYLLNKFGKQFDVLATGHNADDESQAILMNLTRANVSLFPRGGPKTTSNGKGFVKRVKPLYFLTEKEVMTYAFLHNLTRAFSECPYAPTAYRATVREVLNEYERKHPGAKRNVLNHYLKVRVRDDVSTTDSCPTCGEPSASGTCKACRLKESIV